MMPRFLPLLLLLFAGSGAAALVYEVVWLQMLQLVIGSSAVSLAVLLGTFMGGMCLGSLAVPRWMPERAHPLRIYALLEIGIAGSGLVVLCAVPYLGNVYSALIGQGLPAVFLRAAVCAIGLLPPTIMMGATLPVIARWVEATPRGVAWLGFFYGGNIAGAVAGCLFAGFYLLRFYDNATASFAAIAVNLGVAGLAWMLARFAPYHPTGAAAPATAGLREGAIPDTPAHAARMTAAPAPPSPRESPRMSGGDVSSPRAAVFAAIAISGLCALASEVIWTRLLSLLLGATVYTFSIILAVFLIGLGLGSCLGSITARNLARPRLLFVCCQALQVGAIGWAAHAIASSLPYWPTVATSAGVLIDKFSTDLLRCAWAILPSAMLWGASFPLALACLAAPDTDPARVVGRTYAANTLGAIVGALAASLWLIPTLGTQRTQMAMMTATALAAILVFQPRTLVQAVLAFFCLGLAALVGISVPPVPWQLVAYGRQMATTEYGAKPLYFGEGMHSSVAVSQTGDGARFFHISGKTEASSLPKDMRLQRMLGHLPALLHPHPRSVLVVGCGAGVTAGTFVLHPSITRIVICDIEPLIPRVVASHFGRENHHVIRDPRVEIVHDDARHYVANCREKFDVITSDPVHPWVKGSAVLYSQEYFELCRQRLRPGGLMTQWVPLYESNRAVVQSEMATFFTAFPHGTVWANDDEGEGYDTVMLGQSDPLTIDLDELENRFDRRDHVRVRLALTEIGFGSAVALLSTYAGRFTDLRTWLIAAEINRDHNLRLQYLAGLQLDSHDGATTFREIADQREYPDDLFRASPSRLAELRQTLGFAPARSP